MDSPLPVIAIFDIGKTNKKLFLFDEDYTVVFERNVHVAESVDEDGFPCENLETLRSFVIDSLDELFNNSSFQIKAVNFAAYGASLVYLDEHGDPLTPLYNYLKPFPEALHTRFRNAYDPDDQLNLTTGSPPLGNLNSGLQLFRLKYERPDVFKRLSVALHLPQYLSFLLTGNVCSELTSIGCHTALWNFQTGHYHPWVEKEDLVGKLPPIVSAQSTFPGNQFSKGVSVGAGLHDSSAALIPYITTITEPFVLISTGTWCISLNPFNDTPLTASELENDTVVYMSYQGRPVKASRLLLGPFHDAQVKRIARYFNLDETQLTQTTYDPEIIKSLRLKELPEATTPRALFENRSLQDFIDGGEAYHQLMSDLVQKQFLSTRWVILNSSVKKIFVDGGFCQNSLYMNLLADAFPDLEVFSASMPQATAIGAALAIHHAWNIKPLSVIRIQFTSYPRGNRGKLI